RVRAEDDARRAVEPDVSAGEIPDLASHRAVECDRASDRDPRAVRRDDALEHREVESARQFGEFGRPASREESDRSGSDAVERSPVDHHSGAADFNLGVRRRVVDRGGTVPDRGCALERLAPRDTRNGGEERAERAAGQQPRAARAANGRRGKGRHRMSPHGSRRVVIVKSTRGSGRSTWKPARSSGTARVTPKSTHRPQRPRTPPPALSTRRGSGVRSLSAQARPASRNTNGSSASALERRGNMLPYRTSSEAPMAWSPTATPGSKPRPIV